jgi:hypothetical protein
VPKISLFGNVLRLRREFALGTIGAPEEIVDLVSEPAPPLEDNFQGVEGIRSGSLL